MEVTELGVVKDAVVVDACGRLDRKNAAKALGRTPQTLANWKTLGVGPQPFMVNGRAYYNANEVFAFGRGEPMAA